MKNPKPKKPSMVEQGLLKSSVQEPANNFISVYRVTLVKDGRVSFEESPVSNAQQARSIVRKLIEKKGQPDREQFCIIMLNARNEMIGVNIVAVGGLTSTTVSVREVYKPAIVSNSAAVILGHNHPSGDPAPSPEDFNLTKMIVHAGKIIGIHVHDHLIINMEDDRYFSFAENGHIKQYNDEIA